MKPAILTLLCSLVLAGCNSKGRLSSDGQHEIVISDQYMVLKPVVETPTSDASGLIRHLEGGGPEKPHNRFTCSCCGLFPAR